MLSHQPYIDRPDAGRLLANAVKAYRKRRRPVLVLALPRGGVPVAAEVAMKLEAELDVVMVRKVGLPGHPEVAMGAIASVGGGLEVVENAEVMAQFPSREAAEKAFDESAAFERAELERREREYRADRSPIDVEHSAVIIVDDGLATGATMRAALQAVQALNPAVLAAAAPVSLGRSIETVADLADDVVCPWTADDLHAVGKAYRDFGQTTDEEVRELLAAHQEGQ